MNVTELRAALHEHAEQAEDIGSPARIAATHQRVAVVRRRRRAGALAAVAAAAVAVVTAGTLTLLPQHDAVQPAGHRTPAKLAGHRIDPTYRPSPWTFRYVRGVQSARGQRVLDVDLPTSDGPRVIGWGVQTTQLSQKAASLVVDGRVVERSGAGSWSTGDLLSAGRPHHVSVRFARPQPTDRSGLAIYDLVGRVPDGVGDGTSVFRQQIAGDRLLGARFGRPGQRRIAFDVPVPDAAVSFSITCSGVPEGMMAGLTVNGSPLAAAGCQESPEIDPGSGRIGPGSHGWDSALDVRPGATLHVVLALEDHGKQPASTEALVLGAAVYHDAPAVARVAGWGVPALVEGPGGHLYRYARSVESRPGARRLTLHLPAARQTRFVQYASSHARGRLTFRVDGQDADGIEQQDTGGGYGGGHALAPGRAYTVSLTLHHGATPRTVLGLIVSTRTG